MENLKDELKTLQRQFIYQKEECSNAEYEKFHAMDELPEGIYYGRFGESSYYYRLVKPDISDEELNQLLLLRQMNEQVTQTEYLKSIRNSMIFFVVITILSLISAIVFIFSINLSTW